MKKTLLKFVLPIGFGLILSIITIWGLVGCDPIDECESGHLKGNDGSCYSCPGGGSPTYSPVGNCSNAVAGVYCCTGGCSPKTGCVPPYSWKGSDGLCYATSAKCIAAQSGSYKVCRECY
jgi:hypothetical protein